MVYNYFMPKFVLTGEFGVPYSCLDRLSLSE